MSSIVRIVLTSPREQSGGSAITGRKSQARLSRLGATARIWEVERLTPPAPPSGGPTPRRRRKNFRTRS